MKIGEIIQRIQSLYSKGVQSDDSRLSSRHIYNKMLTVRSKLIYQKANKKQKLSQWNFQTLPCVELVKAEVHECPCLPPIGCEILKTKYPLPKPIVNLTSHLIQNVSTIDGSIIYSEIGWNEYKYKKGNKYTANKPDYFIRNGHIFLTYKSGPKVVTVTGLFEDPWEAEKFPSFCEDCTDCVNCENVLDKEFPLDNDLLDVLVEFCIQELIVIFTQNQQDKTNNSKDDNQSNPNE